MKRYLLPILLLSAFLNLQAQENRPKTKLEAAAKLIKSGDSKHKGLVPLIEIQSGLACGLGGLLVQEGKITTKSTSYSEAVPNKIDHKQAKTKYAGNVGLMRDFHQGINSSEFKPIQNETPRKFIIGKTLTIGGIVLILDGLRREFLSADYTLEDYRRDIKFIDDKNRTPAKETEIKSEKPKITNKAFGY